MFRRFLPATRHTGLETQRMPRSVLDLMEDLWSAAPEAGWGQMEFPAVNISEDEKAISVKAELPGMESKDIEISLRNNMLVLQGEKRFEDEQNRGSYKRIERSYGSFYRTIPLSSSVDQEGIKASFRNGVLDITLPKKEAEMGKKIEIES